MKAKIEVYIDVEDITDASDLACDIYDWLNEVGVKSETYAVELKE